MGVIFLAGHALPVAGLLQSLVAIGKPLTVTVGGDILLGPAVSHDHGRFLVHGQRTGIAEVRGSHIEGRLDVESPGDGHENSKAMRLCTLTQEAGNLLCRVGHMAIKQKTTVVVS